MKQYLKSSQRMPFIVGARIAANGTVTQGKSDVTVVKNGTGDYTVTFARSPFAQVPVVVANAVHGSATYYCCIDADTLTAKTVQIITKTDAGVATDVAFHLLALGSGAVGDY